VLTVRRKQTVGRRREMPIIPCRLRAFTTPSRKLSGRTILHSSLVRDHLNRCQHGTRRRILQTTIPHTHFPYPLTISSRIDYLKKWGQLSLLVLDSDSAGVKYTVKGLTLSSFITLTSVNRFSQFLLTYTIGDLQNLLVLRPCGVINDNNNRYT